MKKMLKQVYKTIYDSFTFWKINISTSYVVNIIALHMKYTCTSEYKFRFYHLLQHLFPRLTSVMVLYLKHLKHLKQNVNNTGSTF